MVFIVRARDNNNKLEAFDDRPFAVDAEMISVGMKINFLDLETGERNYCVYASREQFDKEWKICHNIRKE